MQKITCNNPSNLNIVWMLTTTCNYDCWYCPDFLKNGEYRWPQYQPYVNFFESIFSKREDVYLDLVGGEPTLWPDLVKFLKHFDRRLLVDVTSNGSRTIGWWKKNSIFMRCLCLSFHPDTCDPDHMYKVVETVCNNGYTDVHVNLLASKAKLDVIKYLFNKFEESDLKVNVKIKKLYSFNHSVSLIQQNNTEDILEYIKTHSIKRFDYKANLVKPNIGYLNNIPFTAAEYAVSNKNNFEGWTCNASKNRMHIQPNGDVYRASCKVGGIVGNIHQGLSEEFESTVICNKKACSCLDEIILEKWIEQ
jgi:MoaA/NifB/PqqE/SkfB family radical SAM enzyme